MQPRARPYQSKRVQLRDTRSMQRFMRDRTQYRAQIDLITVLVAILTGRQTRLEIQC